MSTIIDKQGNVNFFGKLSWGNFLDWLITLCLGGIIVMTTVHLGGVRPDTEVVLLPLYVLLLVLHGLWLSVKHSNPYRLSRVPFWFLPVLVWMFISVLYVTPVPWLGWYELIVALQAFIFLWVLCNNVGSRAHLWVLIVLSVLPVLGAVFIGSYQFFQNSEKMMGSFTDYSLALPEQYLGRATGVFADPFTLAAFLLIFLPAILTAASAPRLPTILRVLCFYVALMVMAVVVFTQVYWAGLLMVVLVGIVPWFCFRRFKQRLFLSISGAAAIGAALALTVSYHPLFEQGFQRALSGDGEGVRILLWKEALVMAAGHPAQGVGAGAYGSMFEQSSRVSLAKLPESPHNDYLLIMSQLGGIGFILFALPVLFIIFKGWSVWRREPVVIKLRGKEGVLMPPKRFFLSLGLTSALGFALCMSMTFLFHVPAMLLLGVLILAILVKTSFPRKLSSGHGLPARFALLAVAVVGGVSFYSLADDKIRSRSLEFRATQHLDHLVEMQIHLSGSVVVLDTVVSLYEEALLADAKNVDAWVGLSSALCQRYFRSPADFELHGSRAVFSAKRATELSPEYWRGWAQLGIAYAYNAELEQAEATLLKALDLAPNSSEAHYYYAAFIGADGARRDEALGHIERSLEINADNGVARRLEQKLRIL